MTAKMSLQVIKIVDHALGLSQPGYEVTFKIIDEGVKGSVTAKLPVLDLPDVEIVGKAREILRDAFLRLADEVLRPSQPVEEDLSDIMDSLSRNRDHQS